MTTCGDRGADDAADLVARLWWGLDRAFLRHGSRLTIRDAGGRAATLWPLSQVLHAAVLVGVVTGVDARVSAITASLARYDTRRGWTATPGPALHRVVFHDDNAWLGLALVQGVLLGGGRDLLLPPAVRALDVTASGEDPLGGIRWSERSRSRHACVSGPGALLALRIAEATDGPVNSGTRAFVERQLDFLDTALARDDGLVADHVTTDGRIDTRPWSYNQGTALGAHRLAVDLLDRPGSWERAGRLATAIQRHYDVAQLWREPPAFVAVLLRQLMALDAAAGDDTHICLVDAWLDRVASEGLGKDGLVGSGGIGRYGDSRVIDQAAVVQVAALRAMPAAQRRLAC